jgi:glutamate racemase
LDQPAQDSPILLFDSGVGGLTVLGELRELLPQAPVIYAADMAGLPYGAKSEAEIAARVAGLLGRMALLRYGANNLVALGEAKLRGESVDVDDVARAAAGLVLQNHGERLDTVILACTHFPLLEDELRQAFGEGVAFIHGAEGIARRIVSLTEGQDFARSAPDFAVGTGELADFQRLAPAFARYGIDDLRAF